MACLRCERTFPQLPLIQQIKAVVKIGQVVVRAVNVTFAVIEFVSKRVSALNSCNENVKKFPPSRKEKIATAVTTAGPLTR